MSRKTWNFGLYSAAVGWEFYVYGSRWRVICPIYRAKRCYVYELKYGGVVWLWGRQWLRLNPMIFILSISYFSKPTM